MAAGVPSGGPVAVEWAQERASVGLGGFGKEPGSPSGRRAWSARRVGADVRPGANASLTKPLERRGGDPHVPKGISVGEAYD